MYEYYAKTTLPFLGSSIPHDSRENVNKCHFMNNYPVYIKLTLYSAFYDVMYFYMSTFAWWHLGASGLISNRGALNSR